MATSIKDGNYSDASVWDTGTVPTASDDVVIAHHVTVDSASCEAKSVTINVGGWLDITAGNKLTVAGNIIGNAGSSWTSLGGKLTMTSDDTNGSAEIAITASGAYIYMQTYCEVEIQGTQNNWCKIYGDSVDMAYLRVYRCKGEIDYLKIYKAKSNYGAFRVYAIYESEYGGYPMHLKNIWVDDYGGRTFYYNTVYLHSDSYLKYTNMRDINTTYPGGTTSNVYGSGTIYIDFSGYTDTTYGSYLFGTTKIYNNVNMIIKSAGSSSNRLFNYAFDSSCIIQDNAVIDVEAYYGFYAYFYDNASLYFRYKGTSNISMNITWFSNGTLYIDCNNTTGYLRLFRGSYQWKQVEGFTIQVENYNGSQLEIQPSGLSVNNMNMTAESKIIADSILTIPAPCNQYEPLIFCTDCDNKYGQIYWEFEYPYNKDNTNYFVLNDASWDLANGRININANGSVNLYVQPVSFVAGRTGVSITKSGTLSIQYAISQDGGSTWSGWKDLNDTNWGSESGYMGFGNEVIAIKITETGGSSAYIDTIRLPFEYRDLYTSQLTEKQMLTQILGQTNKLTFDSSNNIQARVNDKGVLNDISASDIDTLLSSNHGSGSWEGQEVNIDTQSIADAVWDELSSQHISDGTFGKEIKDLKDNLSVVKSQTDKMQFDAGNNIKSNPQVEVNINSSDKNSIANAVWDVNISNKNTENTSGKILRELVGRIYYLLRGYDK